MWKRIFQIIPKAEQFLSPESLLQQQLRTTFILKRRNAPMLHKKREEPKLLKSKHYIYDIVQNTDIEKQPELDLILTKYVEGIGKAGDKILVKQHFAYINLLLPGLAVYATPENIEKFQSNEIAEEDQHSSPTVQRTLNVLSGVSLAVIMNRENPWVLQPWHVKVSFRKCGYWVPEDTITLPSKPIKGPDMNLEGKQFYVTVTVNNLEKVNVRCILHHWSTAQTNRIQYDFEYWKRPCECIFPEDEPVILSLPSVQKFANNAQI